MSTVIVDLSISVDGYVAGPNDGMDNPLGDGGMALFAWMGAGPPENQVDPRLRPPDASMAIVQEWMTSGGAIITGRRTFDIAHGWAGGHPVDVPIFVVTHDPPTEGEWSPRCTFVPEGVERALALAREVAGDGFISTSGGSIAAQLAALGALDEIQLSVAPVILGGGVSLFEHVGPLTLEQTRVVVSDGVTHLRYRVVRD